MLWDVNKVWLLSGLNIVAGWLWSLRSFKHQWNYCQNWDIHRSTLLLNFYRVSKGECHTARASTGLLSSVPTLLKFTEMDAYPLAKDWSCQMCPQIINRKKRATGWARTPRFDRLAKKNKVKSDHTKHNSKWWTCASLPNTSI